MTREEAIEFGNMWLEVNEDCEYSDVDDRNTYEFFQIAIKALESCEDCISREHLLEEIASLKESPWFKDDTNSAMAIRKEAIEIVEDLCIRKEPSVNSQEPCEDAVSRQAVCNIADAIRDCISVEGYWAILERLKKLPSVNPQKIGHCKDCKYFEYDSVAKVGGIPLIVAHEICNKWGDGCKTSEEGFCFLFEPQEREVAESNSTYCTECPYFNKVIYDGEQWFGARCDKDGHSTMPSMYAIKSLHNDCPLVAEVEPQESEE